MRGVGNFGAGASETIAGVLGAPADITNWAARKAGLTEVTQPLGGSEQIKSAMGAIGADPRTVKANTLGEKVARGAGQGVAGTLLPASMAQGLGAAGALGPRAAEIAGAALGDVSGGSAAVGAGAGAAGVLAEEAVPDKYKTIANFAGQVAGGAAGGLLYAAARGLASKPKAAAHPETSPKAALATSAARGVEAVETALPPLDTPMARSLIGQPTISSGAGFSRIGEAGGAIADNMHNMLWKKVLAGDTNEHGRPSALLQVAKEIRARGGAQSFEQYKALAQDYGNINRGPDFQQQMRTLIEAHTNVTPASIGPVKNNALRKYAGETRAQAPQPELPVPAKSLGSAAGDYKPQPVNVMQPHERFTPGKSMQGVLRQQIGLGTRDSMRSEAAREPFVRQVNKMPVEEQWGIVGHIENRSKGASIPENIKPIADQLQKEFKIRKDKLRNSWSTADMEFQEDYFPHNIWENPRAAQNFAAGFGGKQGSTRNLKKRTIPTISDGLAAGLKLKSGVTPLDAAQMYTSNMDRVIAMNEAFDIAKEQKAIKFALNPSKVPEGWVPLEGRLGRKLTPGGEMRAYAPAEVAKNWNRFVSKGVTWLDTPRAVSNAVTGLELGMSGFHASTMAQEAIVNQFAKGVSQLATSGQRLKGLGTMLKAPAAPVTLAMKGDKARDIYLGLSPGNKESRQLVDLLTEGNARMSKMEKTLSATSAGSFISAYRRGALGAQLHGQAQRIAEAKGIPAKAATAATEFVRDIGRSMDTIMEPLFQYYIPRLKNGAMMENMSAWLEANPAASHNETIAAARKIVDSVDNRFGEMIQDNLFWNQSVKQAAQVGMLSYSWALGTFREIGGGALQLARHPSSLSMKSPHYSPAASYLGGLALAVAFTNGLYQFVKTGEPPGDFHDLIAGRTGGAVPPTKFSATQPERVQEPGYGKDILAWKEVLAGDKTLGEEAYAKMSGATKAIIDITTNKDWRGDPIRNPDSPLLDQMGQVAGHLIDTITPISVGQATNIKKGSNILPVERMFGMKPASPELQNPEAYRKMMKSLHDRRWKTKQAHEKAAKARQK